MKTLQVVGNSSFGGATYLLLNWCKFLLEHGCRVDVVATDRETVRHLLQINGVNVIQGIFIPREISIPTHTRAFNQLLRLLHTNKYDVMHTYTATPGFVGRTAGFLARTSVILHHGAAWTVDEFSTISEKMIFTPLENIIARLGTKIICVSHAVAEQARVFRLAPENKLTVIPNGINPTPFLNRSKSFNIHRQLGLPNGVTLVGSTNRLSPQKDLQCILRAFSNIGKSMPNEIHLVLAGNGPEKESLLGLAQVLGIQAKTHFLGFVNDIPGFLADIDIYVSSTLREGLSISLLEAMAAAKPIIATNILPNKELLNNGESGILVPPRDPVALQKAILYFWQNTEQQRQLGDIARKRVIDHYNIDRTFEETWNLYTSLFSKYARK